MMLQANAPHNPFRFDLQTCLSMPTTLAPDSIEVPSYWLGSTRLLDLNDPKLRIQAMSLTQLSDTDTQKVVAIHEFIKAMPFACVTGFDHVPAATVLRNGYGDCHTKGTLFVALLRCVGLPARLRFVTLSSAFLHGIITPPQNTVIHAIGEVYLDERWIQTDTYVTDIELESSAERLLLDQGRRLGYGIHLDGARQWDAFNDAHGQSAASDEASLPVQDWGVAHDPEQFYASADHPSLRRGWLTRAKWMLAAGLVNRRTQQVRQQGAEGMHRRQGQPP